MTASDASGPKSVEVGTCDLCGQRMLRTPDDCWHPWDVAVACPPEPPGTSLGYGQWIRDGHQTLRPGRQHFVPEGGASDTV